MSLTYELYPNKMLKEKKQLPVHVEDHILLMQLFLILIIISDERYLTGFF